MKLFNLGFGIVVATLTLAAAPAWAQKPESGGGSPAAGAVDRASGGGSPSSGGAVDRSSGGSSSSGSSDGGSSTSSSGGGVSRSSMGTALSPSIGVSDRAVRESAPRHREDFANRVSYSDDGQKATPRASGPTGGGNGAAAPRGGGSTGGSSSAGAGTRAGENSGDNNGARATGRTRTAPAPERHVENSNNSSGAREVPSWSRPRGDRPVNGRAVDRTGPVPDRGGNDRGRSGYDDPYGYGGYGYGGYGYGGYGGYGSGYGYNNYYYPYGFGMGYGLYSGLGWSPYYGDPFGDPYGYGGGRSYASSYGRGEQGNLKLKVKPRAAKVYVDGYFVGYVDQFDGAFQKLALNTGRHRVEVRAEGFETAEFDVLINPEQTVTFQGELKRIQ